MGSCFRRRLRKTNLVLPASILLLAHSRNCFLPLHAVSFRAPCSNQHMNQPTEIPEENTGVVRVVCSRQCYVSRIAVHTRGGLANFRLEISAISHNQAHVCISDGVLVDMGTVPFCMRWMSLGNWQIEQWKHHLELERMTGPTRRPNPAESRELELEKPTLYKLLGIFRMWRKRLGEPENECNCR